MRISYRPLWVMLAQRDMTKKELRERSGISTASLAKLGKGQNITTDVLLKICKALNCNINEIIESIPESGRSDMDYKSTIEYYNSSARDFYNNTVNVELTTIQDYFLAKLKKGDFILDFGCGSGRDTKYFIEKGYQVEAIDGSMELCKLASEYTGIKVKNMFFQELSEVEKYDGIWACSSILHLPIEELREVMKRMAESLKTKGIIYTSFKYGTFAGERNGRFFTDMTEEAFADLMADIEDLSVETQWITSDARPGRGEEKWLNLILRKSQR